MKKIKLVYMGTPEFAVKPLEALLADDRFNVLAVVSQPDKPQGRKKELLPTPVKAVAEVHGIPVLQPIKVRDGALRDALVQLEPDFLLTCAYGRILPADVLAVPKYEALNLHASLLPKYRGAAPIQWALLNGDEETGVSLMRMDEELDHGAIFAQGKMRVDKSINYPELSAELSEVAAQLALGELPRIASGELKGIEQEHEKASFTRMLTKEDGLITWSREAEVIANLVRATYPWPGAYSYLSTKRLKIHRASAKSIDVLEEALKDQLSAMESGQLIKANKRELYVLCGKKTKSLLQLLEVQAEGGKRLTGTDFMQGIQGAEVLA